jgi:branched-chain amino acid transport system permease protein
VELLLERMIQGLQNGAIYASLALALVIIYRTNGLLNFAQGEMAMFSIFITWQFTDWGLPIIPAMLAAMVVSFVLGALIERLLVRPVGDVETNPLALVIVTIGLFLALNALASFIWGTDGKNLPRLFPNTTWDIGGVEITATVVGVLAILAVEVVFLFVLFQRAKIGLAMRAVASTKESSRLVGIRVGVMLMIGWGLAAAIGTVAGVLRVETFPSLSFDANTMQFVLIYAFAAATLGGFDSPVGAVVGGLIVGEVEVLSAAYVDWIGNDLALGSAFVLILAILLVRPQGLFGSKEVIRV